MDNKENKLDELFNKAKGLPQQFSQEEMFKQSNPPSNTSDKSGKSIFNRLSTMKKAILTSIAAIWLIILSISIVNDFNSEQNEGNSNIASSSLLKSSSENATDTSSNSINAQNEVADTNIIKNEENSYTAYPHNNSNCPDCQTNNKRTNNLASPPLKGNIQHLLNLQASAPQKFTILGSQDTIIKAKANTKFHIEGMSFYDKEMQVINDSIQIQIKECYTFQSFVSENLSTSDGNELLESGGMLYFQAFYKGDTAKLRPGYEIGIRPNYDVPERMDWYAGEKDKDENIEWKKDPLGKTPSPILMVTSGKYKKVLDTFFYKNYRIEKSDMLDLIGKNWTMHFTSQERKVVGTFACDKNETALSKACHTFNQDLAAVLAKKDIFPPQSRYTQFGFTCMSKNQYEYGMQKGYIDSFINYIPPSDYNTVDLELPLFFGIGNLGWFNLDCFPSIAINLKWKKINPKKKEDVQIKIPGQLQANAYLYLSDINALSRSVNTENEDLIFKNIISKSPAKLIVTAYENETYYVFEETFTVGEEAPTIKFRSIENAEEYTAWLNAATQMQAN